MSSESRPVVLITGGHGFIGSHVARRLYDSKEPEYFIRIVDIAQTSSLDADFCHECIIGTLCDENVCRQVVKNVHTILHFAANMGGMGAIHESNDFVLYQDNQHMTTNILQAALDAGVKRFFYASSACVYPESLQTNVNGDVSLRENDAWENAPPRPQGLYGTEKLCSEIVLEQYSSKMDIRIARFHNVFGPGGSWNDGREKAPAAMLRKAIAVGLLKDKGHDDVEFEIWGNGQQSRSFLFIDDAVEGVLKLLHSSDTKLCNIGSDRSVTIQDLAKMALQVAAVKPSTVRFSSCFDKPVGVAARNSNNNHVRNVLGWEPTVSLEDGLKQTYTWMNRNLTEAMELCSESEDQDKALRKMLRSDVLQLSSPIITFAILLPVTSRGRSDPNDCLEFLRRFAKSLNRTTWTDCRSQARFRMRLVVYLAIDHDDNFLRGSGSRASFTRAERVLHEENIHETITIFVKHPPGHVCKIWKDCARKAFEDGCDFMVLLGDDVELKDEGWMRAAHTEFEQLASSSKTPFGFGCVAFRDISFPGMPTFPIIHRTHMEIFKGEIVPDIFINQDGDPFLYQLYRRFGCSKMFEHRISNEIGGEASARYVKQSAKGWTFGRCDYHS